MCNTVRQCFSSSSHWCCCCENVSYPTYIFICLQLPNEDTHSFIRSKVIRKIYRTDRKKHRLIDKVKALVGVNTVCIVFVVAWGVFSGVKSTMNWAYLSCVCRFVFKSFLKWTKDKIMWLMIAEKLSKCEIRKREEKKWESENNKKRVIVHVV